MKNNSESYHKYIWMYGMKKPKRVNWKARAEFYKQVIIVLVAGLIANWLMILFI